MISIEVKKSNKCNGEYSLFISFPYNQDIVNIMREQIIRYWIPETKEWELPLKSFLNIINDFEIKKYKYNVIDIDGVLKNQQNGR